MKSIAIPTTSLSLWLSLGTFNNRAQFFHLCCHIWVGHTNYEREIQSNSRRLRPLSRKSLNLSHGIVGTCVFSITECAQWQSALGTSFDDSGFPVAAVSLSIYSSAVGLRIKLSPVTVRKKETLRDLGPERSRPLPKTL